MANASYLRALGLVGDAILKTLTVAVTDELGESSALYRRDDAVSAVTDPMPIKPAVDALVADLLVSAGGGPAASRYLAETGGQPASVVNLMRARLQRGAPIQAVGIDRRSSRGLALFDEWTQRETEVPLTSEERAVPSAAPSEPPAG